MKSIRNGLLVLLWLFFSFSVQSQDVRMKGKRKPTQNPVIKTQEIVSQKNEIIGLVLDGSTGEPLPSATISIVNEEDKGLLTDLEGKFYFEFKEPTTISLRVQYTGFETKEIQNIEIAKGKTRLVTITLNPKELTTEEVVISSTLEQETEVAAILLQKKNLTLTDIYSSEIILRTSTNLNLGNALRRMPGVSFIEDKNLIVRGLIDRYILFTLNGMPVLSNRFDIQTFDYNLFPLIGIKNIMFNKSIDASHLNGASSAWIDLKTSLIPDKNVLEVGTILQYNDKSSFRKLNRFQLGSKGILGFMGKVEGLPENLATTDAIRSMSWNSEELKNEGLKIPNNIAPESYYSTLNQRWYAKIDRKWTKAKNTFGFSVVTDILNEKDAKYRNTLTTGKINSEGKVTISNKGDYYFNELTNMISNYIAGGWKNDKFSLEVCNYYSSTSNNFIGTLYGQTLPFPNAPFFINITYAPKKFTTNQLNTTQFKFTYKFNEKQSLDLNVFNNYSLSEMPLSRGELYNANNQWDTATAKLPFAAKFYNFYTTKQLENQRGANLNHQLAFGNQKQFHIQSGIFFSQNQTDFSSRSIGFFPSPTFALPLENFSYTNQANIFAPENIGPNGFYLKESTQKKDNYTGSNQVLAFYTQPTWDIHPKVSLTLGVRGELFHQKMQPKVIDSTAVLLDTTNFGLFPNALLKFQATENLIFKAGYYKTINRTSFNDLSRFVFFENLDGFRYAGNPKLTYCTQNHFELKTEYYFSGKEVISLSGFYKHFQNPFEQYRTATSTDLFIVRNIQKAKVYGFELEIRKSFDFLSDALDNLFFYGNFSFIRSQTQDTTTGYVSRKLQGQADYINNSGLLYSFKKQQMEIGVFYNYVGKLIYYVGTNSKELPDIWQLPRHVLDLQIGKTFKNLELKLIFVDLFNQPYRRAILFGKNYDKNRDLVVYSTQRGFRTQLAINYRF